METSCSFDSLCAGEGDESLKITGQIDAVQALVQVRSVCPEVVPISHYQTVRRKGFSAMKMCQFFCLAFGGVEQGSGKIAARSPDFCSAVHYRNSFL